MQLQPCSVCLRCNGLNIRPTTDRSRTTPPITLTCVPVCVLRSLACTIKNSSPFECCPTPRPAGRSHTNHLKRYTVEGVEAHEVSLTSRTSPPSTFAGAGCEQPMRAHSSTPSPASLRLLPCHLHVVATAPFRCPGRPKSANRSHTATKHLLTTLTCVPVCVLRLLPCHLHESLPVLCCAACPHACRGFGVQQLVAQATHHQVWPLAEVE
jgi:hypothetical protein